MKSKDANEILDRKECLQRAPQQVRHSLCILWGAQIKCYYAQYDYHGS